MNIDSWTSRRSVIPFSRPPAWLLRIVAIVLALVGDSHISAQVPEALFALENSGPPRLLELNSQTGVAIRQLPYVNWIGAETALAFGNGRVFIRGNTNWNADRLIRAHPCDGGAIHLASTPLRLIADDFDPVSGEVNGVCQNLQAGGTYCCRFSSITGALVLGPQITTTVGITAMAVDPAGTTYVSTAGGGAKLHILDMATGVTTFVGDLAVPTTLAQDLAFNNAGQLWASLHDVVTGADTGLYTVDPLTYAATRVIATPTLYLGIAFAPKTSPSHYCVAKVSSLGCHPTLSADGFASPTGSLGFTISTSNLNNNRPGLLLYGAGGRASLPFQGGLLCLAAPISRSPGASTGGSPAPVQDCSGTWSIDYNAMIWQRYGGPHVASANAPAVPFTVPGTTVQCQFWGRDSGFAAPNNSMLSDGLEFTLSP
jgi:hypothetical protein